MECDRTKDLPKTASVSYPRRRGYYLRLAALAPIQRWTVLFLVLNTVFLLLSPLYPAPLAIQAWTLRAYLAPVLFAVSLRSVTRAARTRPLISSA